MEVVVEEARCRKDLRHVCDRAGSKHVTTALDDCTTS